MEVQMYYYFDLQKRVLYSDEEPRNPIEGKLTVLAMSSHIALKLEHYKDYTFGNTEMEATHIVFMIVPNLGWNMKNPFIVRLKTLLSW